MLKALLDTSAYIDIRKADRHRRSSWAQNTLRNLVAYRAEHPKLTLSIFTVYEILDGIFRGSTPEVEERFAQRRAAWLAEHGE